MQNQPLYFEANCQTTAMSILPFTDKDTALELVLGLDVPFWPQLPNISFSDDMYAQALYDFPGITIDPAEGKISFNHALFEDFPEVCVPIRALEGRPARTVSQTVQGIPTAIQWNMDKLVLPTLEESVSSGSTVSVCGITGDIRGQQETTIDGTIIRPDLCIIDDPQTRESAASEKQCNDRIETIQGDILGLAGPGIKIACIMPCTVIHQYDAV